MKACRASFLCLVGAALAVFGCAGPRLRMVPAGAAVDPAPLAATLAAYNAAFPAVRVVGSLRFSREGTVDFGARAERGTGVRIDAVSGPGKLAFSVACREAEGCSVYLPDAALFLRDDAAVAARWLASLVAGRVMEVGPPVGAWRSPAGALVLRLASPRHWQTVEFDAEGRLPRRVLYGETGGGPEVEVLLDDFRTEEGGSFPHAVRVAGDRKGEEVDFSARRVLPAGDTDAPPAGVEVRQGGGGQLWRELGLPLVD
jgi:hypothetical protein